VENFTFMFSVTLFRHKTLNALEERKPSSVQTQEEQAVRHAVD
jgi:hypothetical protein